MQSNASRPTFATMSGNESLIPNSELAPRTTQKSTIRSMKDDLKKGHFRFTTWRMGAIGGITATLVVFLINLISLLYVVIRSKDDTIYNGDCGRAKQISLVLHIFINIFSTILLSASNYCTQILTAPTREDIDRAHKKGRWMDIGIISLRNFQRLRWPKIALWFILVLSSLPLHLFYNSTVFTTIQAVEYTVAAIPQSRADSYMAQRAANRSSAIFMEPLACIDTYATTFVSNYGDLAVLLDINETEYQYGKSSQCYGSGCDLPSERTPYPSETLGSTAPGSGCPKSSYNWICHFWDEYPSNGKTYCGDICRKNEILQENSSGINPWNIRGYKVTGCIADRVDEFCGVRFQKAFMAVVIISNFCKLIAIYITVAHFGDEKIFATIGDAIASFLEFPDTTTKDMCLATKSSIKRSNGILSHNDTFEKGPKPWTRKPQRWFRAVGIPRWLFTFTAAIAGLVVASTYLGRGLLSISDKGSGFADFEFGEADPRAVVDDLQSNDSNAYRYYGRDGRGQVSLAQIILLANCPQVILSVLYLLYNSIFTAMAISREMDSFSEKPTNLRVSEPTDGQRGTYFLQLPYRLSIPLMMISALLHWLYSQSIFLISINAYPTYPRSNEYLPTHVDQLGYSPQAIVVSIVITAVILLGALAVGTMFKTKGVVPAVGSCSAAISAICHRPEDDKYASLRRIQWGEIDARYAKSSDITGVGNQDSSEEQEWSSVSGFSYHSLPDSENMVPNWEFSDKSVGHCCLTSFPVKMPKSGWHYE